MSVIAAILSGIGALITALGGLWIGVVKARADTQAVKGSRMDVLEARIDRMQADLDDERAKRRGVEVDNHRLRMALVTAVKHLEQLIRWADGGAKPPRPDDIDLDEIKDLLKA
ncbi:putative secreted protein [Corynebacterium phage LGCM-V6]|uniref:hypothetical protein n=1 Tax=Corynebacterium pseudotuberculosis TaxID=1719 RepID=UPI00065E2B58|nr:hypothetical protein [Corynebacterium pseudotuberculosis]AQY55175.1 membrane protein [Corynebacterium phage LGCM-VI]ARM68579.1 putative secreted protein [Corynebacterium phage LGCM-V2]ARM68627.1 putative secreted protein [Corynebacterium phage LGCM-V3]ARM68676.1 putative secreted protein [Corynebacterium phage LGCM-V4]ARM68724.1 putative secreted protein [Corynebacterium phage LGCM-V6]ARM68772.1 putative secreted protein [Corynebacterium phage LGCM-V5]ARM68820.1 putative secreted protein 